MQVFDIGFVPAGWTRGERLQVRQASRTRDMEHLGTVMQHPDDIFLKGPGQVMRGDHVAYVTFRPGDEEKVKAWIRWWHEGDKG